MENVKFKTLKSMSKRIILDSGKTQADLNTTFLRPRTRTKFGQLNSDDYVYKFTSS